MNWVVLAGCNFRPWHTVSGSKTANMISGTYILCAMASTFPVTLTNKSHDTWPMVRLRFEFVETHGRVRRWGPMMEDVGPEATAVFTQEDLGAEFKGFECIPLSYTVFYGNGNIGQYDL